LDFREPFDIRKSAVRGLIRESTTRRLIRKRLYNCVIKYAVM